VVASDDSYRRQWWVVASFENLRLILRNCILGSGKSAYGKQVCLSVCLASCLKVDLYLFPVTGRDDSFYGTDRMVRGRADSYQNSSNNSTYASYQLRSSGRGDSRTR
jgi:hypothetical protein